MAILREVILPGDVSGKLLLTHMPGRKSDESYATFAAEAREKGIGSIICLTGQDEIRAKSPEYHEALESGSVRFNHIRYPIPDYGTPADLPGFHAMVTDAAERIRRGENIVMHCGAGYGRTGMTAVIILMALGLSPENAMKQVIKAGSQPETPSQIAFIATAAERYCSALP